MKKEILIEEAIVREEAQSLIDAITSRFKDGKFTDEVFKEENLLVISDALNCLLNTMELCKVTGSSTEEVEKLTEIAAEKLLERTENLKEEAKLMNSEIPLTFTLGTCLRACSRFAAYPVWKETFLDVSRKLAEELLSLRGSEIFWSWGAVEDLEGKDIYATYSVVEGLGSYLLLKRRDELFRRVKRAVKEVAEELLKLAKRYDSSNIEEPLWHEWIDRGRKRPLDHFCGLCTILSALKCKALRINDLSAYERPFVEACRTAISIKLSQFNYFDYHRYVSHRFPAIFVEEGIAPFLQFSSLARLYTLFPPFLKKIEDMPLLVQEFLEEMEILLTSTLTRQRTAEVFSLIRKIRNREGLWVEGSSLLYLTAEGISAYTYTLRELSREDSLWLRKESMEEYTKFIVAKSAKEILQSETFSSNFAYQLYLALENKIFPALFRK